MSGMHESLLVSFRRQRYDEAFDDLRVDDESPLGRLAIDDSHECCALKLESSVAAGQRSRHDETHRNFLRLVAMLLHDVIEHIDGQIGDA